MPVGQRSVHGREMQCIQFEHTFRQRWGCFVFFFFKLAGYRFECLAENLASEDPKHLDVS